MSKKTKPKRQKPQPQHSVIPQQRTDAKTQKMKHYWKTMRVRW